MNKLQFLQYLHQFIVSKVERLQNEINDLQRDNASDTKSTAGDKHETGRAMLHLEMEKLSTQLQEYQQQLQTINGYLSQTTQPLKIANGSLIELSSGWFFLGLPIGKVTFNNTPVFCLSQQAPLGQELMGKEVGESVLLQTRKINIISIK
ncbi:MAG: GreA/GreB family elongation factor [Crocinitomicaceae bacterium]|nr:GreA/GreB family elongation factor [Crocinitomicaceae bacterium]